MGKWTTIAEAAIELLAKKSGGALPAATVPPKTLPTDEASRMTDTVLARTREMPDDQALKVIDSRIGQIKRDAKARGAEPSGPYAIELGALQHRRRELKKGLPSDEASRMARAREMGFDTDVYHATTKDFDEFDPARFGENTGAKDAALGAWFSDVPEATKYFGGYSDDLMTQEAVDYFEAIRPLTKKYRLAKDSLSRDQFDSPWKYLDARKALKEDYENAIKSFGPEPPSVSGYDEGANIVPAKLRGKNLLEVDASIYTPTEFNHVARSAMNEGYDGVRFKGVFDLDEAPVKHDQFVVFDPKNIRSRFAQFDPAKKDSADILAGLGVVGAGAALSQQDGFDYGALSNVAEESNVQSSN